MSRREVFFIAGARPNFMKIAPILRAFAAHETPFLSRLVHTGQHYDEGMSDVFFQQLGIPEPDFSLGVGSGSHGEQTARVLSRFEQLLLERPDKPAGVVVVGDVNSTVACALAAVKLSIPVAHVEAGLRSFDRSMPEEINRILTDAMSDLLLITEESGRKNLIHEGIPEGRIRLVGNVMIDTLYAELGAARALDMPKRFGVAPKHYGLVTLHRPSNVDHRSSLSTIIDLLGRVSERLPLILPLHPRTKERIRQFELDGAISCRPAIHVTTPLGYHETLGLMENATVVLTDSGGIQEETSALSVPCLTLRENTERPVTVDVGTNTLVGSDLPRVEPLIDDIIAGRYKTGSAIRMWDGHAADRVRDAIVETWGSDR